MAMIIKVKIWREYGQLLGYLLNLYVPVVNICTTRCNIIKFYIFGYVS